MTKDVFDGKSNEENRNSRSGYYNMLSYHMEQKYLCDQYVESCIDLFGTSPCKVATEKGLELLVLDRRNISDIGDIDRVLPFVKNVTELDLSWNNISSWSVVATLLSSMPALKLFNLSHNPIDSIAPLIESKLTNSTTQMHRRRNSTGEMENRHDYCYLSSYPSSSSFQNFEYHDTSASALLPSIPICNNLQTLILNGVQLPLRTLQRFVNAAPSLRELHLAENPVNDKELKDLFTKCGKIPFSQTVQILNLNNCKINKWRTVLQFLKIFPSTTYLFVADNQISHIHFDDSTVEEELSIRSLTLNGNDIASWLAIENLSQLQWLEELRIRNVPLFFDYKEEERHHLVVGRIQTLTCLNGSIITPYQREESERFLIRFYQNSLERPDVYNRLVARHGNLEELVKVDLTPKRFANVILRCDETNYYMRAKIRLNCTVYDLMRHSEKITGIAISRMRIFYFDGSICGPVELRLPTQKLKSLHIEDGDQFFIQSKILQNKLSPTKQSDIT